MELNCRYFDPKPLFQIFSHSGFYECKLTLPANAAFPELVGPVSKSSYLSKKLVCLNACKKLHEIGALDDHLLPVIEERIETNHAEIVNSALGAGTCLFHSLKLLREKTVYFFIFLPVCESHLDVNLDMFIKKTCVADISLSLMR